MTLTCSMEGHRRQRNPQSITNYYGTIGGEITPLGLAITLPATGFLTGGTGMPDMDVAINNLGEQEFEYV